MVELIRGYFRHLKARHVYAGQVKL